MRMKKVSKFLRSREHPVSVQALRRKRGKRKSKSLLSNGCFVHVGLYILPSLISSKFLVSLKQILKNHGPCVAQPMNEDLQKFALRVEVLWILLIQFSILLLLEIL